MLRRYATHDEKNFNNYCDSNCGGWGVLWYFDYQENQRLAEEQRQTYLKIALDYELKATEAQNNVEAAWKLAVLVPPAPAYDGVREKPCKLGLNIMPI